MLRWSACTSVDNSRCCDRVYSITGVLGFDHQQQVTPGSKVWCCVVSSPGLRLGQCTAYSPAAWPSPDVMSWEQLRCDSRGPVCYLLFEGVCPATGDLDACTGVCQRNALARSMAGLSEVQLTLRWDSATCAPLQVRTRHGTGTYMVLASKARLQGCASGTRMYGLIVKQPACSCCCQGAAV
jgi:hypothetical protein